MMFNKFFPKKTLFFDLLDAHAALTYQAALKFQESLTSEINLTSLLQIKTLEHEADHIARKCSEKLHTTFITPIDRDQIYHLVSRIDDVIDAIDATADSLIIYKISTPTKELIALACTLTYTAFSLQQAVNGLRDLKKGEPIREACAKVIKFEHEADNELRAALENLFENVNDAKQLIIWKEIYETLEAATDRCSDAADTIEGILLEND